MNSQAGAARVPAKKAYKLQWYCSKASTRCRANCAVISCAAAVRIGCHRIAFTYNDPVIFAEYAIDRAQAAHERGIKTVAVTAGYINPEPRRDFDAHMDAANVDLKALTGELYHKLCFGRYGCDVYIEAASSGGSVVVIRGMEEGWILTEGVVTANLPLEKFEEGLRLMESGAGGSIKAVLVP